jgi:outer membrane lipopolysaccharide assembly protein LptE/RlpB
MEYKMRSVLLMAGVLGLSACSDKLPPNLAMSEKEFEYRTEQVEKQIDDMPKWYTNIPKEDDAVYAVGTAVTPDLQLSVDIAVLSAKTTLADRVDSRIRSQLKTFKSKLGSTDFDSNVAVEFEQVTRNLIADADVAGYTVKENVIVQNGTQYRSYVLLEYKNEVANRVIQTRLAKNNVLLSKLKSTQAWKELDINVEAQQQAEVNTLKALAE